MIDPKHSILIKELKYSHTIINDVNVLQITDVSITNSRIAKCSSTKKKNEIFKGLYIPRYNTLKY